MAFVNLSSLPKQAPEQAFDYGALNGGVNLRDAELRLKSGESPESVNLWWEDGILQTRPGQEYASPALPEINGRPQTGYACTEEPFHGHIFCHIGSALYAWNAGDADADTLPAPVLVTNGHAPLPENAGTFFRFDEYLFYKNAGAYLKITWSRESGQFTASDVEEEAFVPTRLINADPATGSGDLYQPENRLSPRKRIVYNAAVESVTVIRVGNGTRRSFLLGENGLPFGSGSNEGEGGSNDSESGSGEGEGGSGEGEGESGDNGGAVRGSGALDAGQLARLSGLKSVYIDGAYQESALYTLDIPSGVVIFNAPPDADTVITFTVNLNQNVYHLPVHPVDSVVSVWVTDSGGAREVPEETGNHVNWTADLTRGTVTFASAPAVTDPPRNNTVEIVYSKRDQNAVNEIMNCRLAAVCGTGTELCVVLSGNESQRNRVFWTGHGLPWRDDTISSPSGSSGDGTRSASPVLNYAYWPFPNDNLIGDSQDGVTGFGQQYGDLLVFQSGAIGKLTASTVELDGRTTVSLEYARVNARIGCGCPGSIQTVENNLVFCDKSGGVYQVRQTSAAYENNVECVSGKVNGSRERPGLLLDLEVSDGASVTSHDDGRRYWLCVNGHVWVWDYELSGASEPVWFFFNGFPASGGAPPVGWFRLGRNSYHLNRAGRVTKLGRVLSDYGAGIPKAYQFPVRMFGSYDRLKDVRTLLLSTRDDTPGNTTVIYQTDYENRADLTNLVTAGHDRLGTRDLTVRDLSVPRYAHVFRRRPMCRHVRHFALRLENNEPGMDLSVLSVRVLYRLLGRDR